MKISKSLLQVIAVAVTVGALQSCTKDDTKPNAIEKIKDKVEKQVNPGYNCPGCGMG